MHPIRKMNPLTHTHKMATKFGDVDISNQEILNYCQAMGLGLAKLNALIPPYKTDESAHVGNIYGFPLFIAGTGKFVVKTPRDQDSINYKLIGTYDYPFSEMEVESYDPAYEIFGDDEDDEECNHGFLVIDRDNRGNKWWCKECNERWPVHPDDLGGSSIIEPFQVGGIIRIGEIIESSVIDEFRDGLLCLREAAASFGVSIRDFGRVLRDHTSAFRGEPEYEDIYTLGSLQPQKMFVRNSPGRTSDPEEVDDYFGDMQMNLTDWRNQMYDKFDDIIRVECEVDVGLLSNHKPFTPIGKVLQKPYYLVHLINDDIQRVYMRE